IHPDYYRIPIADREALLAEEAALRSEPVDELPDYHANGAEPAAEAPEDAGAAAPRDAAADDEDVEVGAPYAEAPAPADADDDGAEEAAGNGATAPEGEGGELAPAAAAVEPVQVEAEESVDTVGGDEVEEAARRRAQLLRRYKIQEV